MTDRAVRRGVTALACLVAPVVLAGAPAVSAQAARTVTPVETGIALFVGQATPVAPALRDGVVAVTAGTVSQTLWGVSADLSAALTAFFDQGGTSAMVVPTTDESAPTLSAALRSIGPVGGADLVTVPALGSLAGPAYLSVVTALDAVAVQAHGIALLDPPAAVVAQVQQDPAHDPAPLVAVAGQVRSALANPSTAVMYSSSLTDTATGASVPASAAVAGMIATTDEQVGVWGQPAGLGHPLTGLTPALVVPTASAAALSPAGVNPFRVVPGYGLVVWGARTLDVDSQDWRYLSVRRTMDFLEQSMDQSLQAYVFQSNNAQTWAQVNASLSAFLTSVWKQGGLMGATASQAFSVDVGLGSTMTSQDILNGFMNVTVGAAVERPGEFIVLTLQQQMQTS